VLPANVLAFHHRLQRGFDVRPVGLGNHGAFGSITCSTGMPRTHHFRFLRLSGLHAPKAPAVGKKWLASASELSHIGRWPAMNRILPLTSYSAMPRRAVVS
jgi:hypothetical protein